MSLKDLLEKTRASRGKLDEASKWATSEAAPAGSAYQASPVVFPTDPPSPSIFWSFLLISRGSESSLDFEQVATRQGYRLTRVPGIREAKAALERSDFDIAVIWDDVSVDLGLLLAATIHSTRSGAKIIALLPGENSALRERLGAVGVQRVLAAPAPITAILSQANSVAHLEPDLTRFGEASEKQISILQNLLKVSGENRENLWLLGFAYYRARQFQDAIATLNRLLQVDPRDAQGHYYLGSCYFRMGMRELAVAEWKKVLALAPDQLIARRAKEHLERTRVS